MTSEPDDFIPNPTVTVLTSGFVASASTTSDVATNRSANQSLETLKRIAAMLQDFDGGTWPA